MLSSRHGSMQTVTGIRGVFIVGLGCRLLVRKWAMTASARPWLRLAKSSATMAEFALGVDPFKPASGCG